MIDGSWLYQALQANTCHQSLLITSLPIDGDTPMRPSRKMLILENRQSRIGPQLNDQSETVRYCTTSWGANLGYQHLPKMMVFQPPMISGCDLLSWLGSGMLRSGGALGHWWLFGLQWFRGLQCPVLQNRAGPRPGRNPCEFPNAWRALGGGLWRLFDDIGQYWWTIKNYRRLILDNGGWPVMAEHNQEWNILDR